MTPAPRGPVRCVRDRLNETTASGVGALLTVYVCWGLFPLYWSNFRDVPPLEVVCHRSIWGLVLLVPMLCGGCGRELLAALRTRRDVFFMGLCSVVHMTNWSLNIWGASHGRVLEISLGNYILPLLCALAGCLVFHERPRPLQWLAIGVAAAGVAVMTLRYGAFPWLALAVGATSAAFAVFRKHTAVNARAGLVMELLFTLPVVGAYLLWLMATGKAAMGQGDTRLDLLLVGGGVLTALTQLIYNFGLHRARMTTISLLQYVMPSVSFLLGILAFNEPVTPAHVTGFACIWTGLVLYTLDSRRSGA